MSQHVVASYCPVFLKKEMRHIYRQVTGLNRYRTFIITPERQNAEIYPFPDVELLPSPNQNILRYVWLKFFLGREKLIYRGEYEVLGEALNRRTPSLLHVYFGHIGVHLLPFLKERKLPALVSFHGMDVSDRGERGFAEKMILLFSVVDLVLARSDSLAERLVTLGCPREKIRLNRTAIPMADFPYFERSVPADGVWRIVQACRLIEKKGLRTALRAFAGFLKNQPNAEFTIAGDGPLLEDLKSLATSLGVSEKVKFSGFQSQSGLRQLFEKSHLFLHPSETTASHDQEGVPNSILEAMATGLPIVATRHGGIPEAVQDGKQGILCKEGDVNALTAALVQLTNDPAQWRATGVSAAEFVRERFSLETQIANLEACYDEAISKYRSTAIV